jgi:hypothetical protein
MLSTQEKQLFDLEPSTAPLRPPPSACNPVQTPDGNVETDAILATIRLQFVRRGGA